MLPDERTTHNHELALPSQVEALVVAPARGASRPIVAFLRQQGINVQTTDDADSAFEEALMHPPDVIFVDDRIPPAGGIELTQRLKSNVRTHFVPAIVIAMSDLRAFRLRAYAAGADAVFTPATDAQERRARLWALLRTRALHRRFERRQRTQGAEIVERRRWVAFLLHDLQGSVAALRANVDYMSRFGPPPTDPRRGDFDDAVEDTRTVFDQLMHSVRTVIDFERFETGQLVLESAPVRAGEILAGIDRELRRHALVEQKGMELARAADERLVSADSELLRRAMLNLVMHCLRRGDGKTTIRVANEGGGVRISFGCGAAGAALGEAERRTMFEPYAQLGDRPVGYGLGLAMARAVVELHEGQIFLEDVAGGGFTFVVLLPGAEAAARRLARRSSKA